MQILTHKTPCVNPFPHFTRFILSIIIGIRILGYEIYHIGGKCMTKFVDWLNTQWEALERQEATKYSARRLSMAAGLSPNTLYQLLNHPEVKPSPETCHKLAIFFDVEPLLVLELAGHVETTGLTNVPLELETALQRPEMRRLVLDAKDLPPGDIHLVQQMVDQLRVRRRKQDVPDVARGAAVALVVEDTADSRSAFVTMLKMAGLKVLEATDGKDAVEKIETSGDLIDIVITDYRMPRMDGVEATREIRKQFPDMPILFVSAWDEPEMKAAAFEVGAADYLVAPIGYEELMDAVSRVRRRRIETTE